jgi:hypothetical protein
MNCKSRVVLVCELRGGGRGVIQDGLEQSIEGSLGMWWPFGLFVFALASASIRRQDDVERQRAAGVCMVGEPPASQQCPRNRRCWCSVTGGLPGSMHKA